MAKKFERLTAEERKDEIRKAAIPLFLEKGFRSTTMENIVSRTSLSKGGVYRLYGSTRDILRDIMHDGMRMRNAFYHSYAERMLGEGTELGLPLIVDMVSESLFMAPEISELYAEFLWEKRRDEELEALYEDICAETERNTGALIKEMGADALLPEGSEMISKLTELMNAATLSLAALGWKRKEGTKEELRNAILKLLMK